MAQGTIKPSKKPAAGGSNGRAKAQPKKGARVAKPRKSSGADKMQKKYAAGMVAKTEKLLGERAGHLELIGQGKKGKDKRGGGGKTDQKTNKGGSKKFG